MNTKRNVILGLVSIFLFFGVLSSFVSPTSHSTVSNTANLHEAQITISPLISAQPALQEITIQPTATPTPTPKPTITPLPSPTPTISIDPIQPTTSPASDQSTGLSNDNYYTNSSGNEVHSPAYSTDNSVPAGATALCGDGTYSFSQSRSGTCSHHGGVAEWL